MSAQTACFVNDSGYKYMNEYDYLPFDVRKRLQNCKYNLCAYCVMKYSYEFGDSHYAIEYMVGILDGKDMRRFEDMIRRRQNENLYNFMPKYEPKYFDDREYKVKQDYFTQRMQLYDNSYMLDYKSIFKTTDFI